MYAFIGPAVALLLGSHALLGQSYKITTLASAYPSGFINAADSVYYNDLTIDSAGNLYYAVSDAVFKISHGVTTQVAGKDTIFFPHYESGLGVGADGSLYTSNADEGCDVVRILNGVVTEFAGRVDKSGFDGDGGLATLAALSYPKGVVEDSAGRVYIADGDNNRVRMVSDGIITTVAGNGDDMRRPSSLAIDSAGTLYIADSLNNLVRKLSNGKLVTVAGNETLSPGFSGDGGLATRAQLNLPNSVALDSAGNLYIADVKNNRIRKVSGGVITTIADDGTPGFRGDDGPAASAWLNGPRSVAVDASGNVYISDALNMRIRLLTPTLRSRNSASYATVTAPDMIAFGESTDLMSAFMVAAGGPWPIDLGGVSVKITDSERQTLSAPIYFVTNGQFAYLVPGVAAVGPATLELTTPAGVTSSTPIKIERVAAGLYAANSGGTGVARGYGFEWTLTARRPGATCSTLQNRPGAASRFRWISAPGSDQIYLSLYGTRFRRSSSVSARVGGVTVPVSGFAAVNQYAGEDQVNIGPLPSSLMGRGEMDIVVSFDGKAANTVTASIR